MRYWIVLLLLLAGCTRMPVLPLGPLKPYRIDIQQGNHISQEMIAKLKPGMTRNQVRFALGTPLIVDPFRKDRWDYVYFLEKDGVVRERRRIVVLFENDRLLRIEGDVVAGPEPGAAAGERSTQVPQDRP